MGPEERKELAGLVLEVLQETTLDKDGQPKPGKTSARERLLIGLISVVLGSGSGAAVFKAAQAWLPPHPDVVALRAEVETLKSNQTDIARVAQDTYDIVDQKHPR